MKMIISSVVLLLLVSSNVLCNIVSHCSHKEVMSAYIDTAVTSISKAKHILPVTDCSSHCNATSNCTQTEVINAYLDIAVDVISKMNYINFTDNNCPNCEKIKAVDCLDVFRMGHNKSGIYEIWPNSRATEAKSVIVFCDMDTDGGGWTVIQRRGDFGSPKDYFYKGWNSYKEGFGKLEKDFWLGNDNIFALTNQKLYSVRFDLKDVNQTRRYALYEKFWIAGEDHNYTLHISNYSGNAGDSMGYHNKQEFATKDRDNSKHYRTGQKCAETHKGGWWYKSCHYVNINGLYYKGKHAVADGVTWRTWKGDNESLEWTEIKIRPRYFKTSFASEV